MVSHSVILELNPLCRILVSHLGEPVHSLTPIYAFPRHHIAPSRGGIFRINMKMTKLFSNGVVLHVGDEDMTVLDLGCGFDEGMGQASVKDAVGIDLNFHRGEAMVEYPIMGDVCHVPIRDECIDYIHAHAILEHLPRPGLCLDEMKRTMRAGAQGSVLLPVDSHNVPQILRRFIKEFPFSLGWVLDKLFRSVTLWRAPGMLHISQVNVEDVERWFKVDYSRVKYNRRLHKWFVHMAPFTILCRLGWIRRLEVEEYAEMIIPINHVQKGEAS